MMIRPTEVGGKLTPTESAVLAYLEKHGEKATSEVAAAFAKSHCWASKYLWRLHGKERVERRLANDVEDIHTTWALWRAR